MLKLLTRLGEGLITFFKFGLESARRIQKGGEVFKTGVLDLTVEIVESLRGGGCGGELKAAAKTGCDTFITSDLRYNMFRDAYDLGINLIDAGHFHTENPICAVLAEKLQSAFPEIEVILSKKHADHGKFFV